MQAVTNLREMQAESETWNCRLVGHHNLNGHGDGMQLVKVGPYVYVAHLGTSDMALSILDCSDPSDPRLVRQLPHPPNTHRHKVQIVGNVLIQNNEQVAFPNAVPGVPAVTGIDVFNLDDPTDPRKVGFYPVSGRGVHRMWYSEAPYAHVAAWLPNVRTRAYHIVDLTEPKEPRMAGCWWVPGTGADDPDPWAKLAEDDHYQVHGVIPLPGPVTLENEREPGPPDRQRHPAARAYVSCTDAGMAILDISDVSAPKLVSRINWHPPYGGYAHTALPLPARKLVVMVCESVRASFEEDGDKRIWVVDVREERQPVMISSFPRPVPPRGSPWASYYERPLRFGPHNVHENRPGSFQSDTRIYTTWFSGGLRITDISDPDRPTEIGHFVPPPAPGKGAPQTNDLFVDADGLIYLTDRVGGGLYVVEYTGG